MLTRAAQYAMRSTLYLASKSSKSNKVNITQLSEELEVPSPFLAKVLQQLVKAGLVSSEKGPNGGFFFSEANQDNSLWDVVKHVDGEKKFQICFMGRKSCNSDNPCAFHDIAIDFRENLMHRFKDKSFSTLVSELNSSYF